VPCICDAASDAPGLGLRTGPFNCLAAEAAVPRGGVLGGGGGELII